MKNVVKGPLELQGGCVERDAGEQGDEEGDSSNPLDSHRGLERR